MKKLLSILIFIFLITYTYAQDLPVACGGSIEKYGVIGNNGISDFYWEVTNGNIINNYNDSIIVQWDSKNDVGVLKVTELSEFGCEGNPLYENIIISIPIVDIGIDQEICENDTYEFTTSYNDTYSYLWQDNSTNYNLLANTSGQYWINVTDSNNCSLSDTANLIVNPLPYVNLGNDTLLCYEDELLLDVSEYGISYTWYDNSINSTLNVYSDVIEQEIWVNVMDEKGCIGSDTIIIRTCGEFNIPNAFTPNEDGYNETWVIEDLYVYPNVTINVYNRWGDRVFYTKGYGSDQYWDGRDIKGYKLPMDTYYYVIDLQNGDEPLVGTVTIIR